MTNEQREAIEICEHYKNILYACNYEKGPERTGQAIETALSLIKENSAEIQQKNTELAEKSAEIEKKDKQIDLMANYIVDLIKYNNPEEKREVEEIKQYFERKVEDVKD